MVRTTDYFNGRRKERITMQETEFVMSSEVKGIGIKSALMEYAALRRGFKVKRLSNKDIIVSINSKNKLAFSSMNGVHSSVIGKRICDNKDYTLKLLKKEVQTTKSKAFRTKDYSKALAYIKKIGFPVIVKPNSLSRGRGVTLNINNTETFKEAWNRAFMAYKSKQANRIVLVEKYFPGENFRFFIVENQIVSVTHRKRAFVIGNGMSTVRELILLKNEKRAKNPYLYKSLIPTNIEELESLSEAGLNLEYTPVNNEEIQLRSVCNLWAGGESIDFTDTAHNEFSLAALKAVHSIPGMTYAGVDIITKDILKKPNSNNYVVNEVEYSPAPMAHFPINGLKRDMAGKILEYYTKNTCKNSTLIDRLNPKNAFKAFLEW